MYDIIEPGGLLNPGGRYVCADTIGLDYESAVEAMPRWYGVSFGNGNDGVSHTYANFYVRTCEPYILAAAAMLSDFKPGEGIAWCAENMQIDGEAEYVISATLYDPPDNRDDYERELEAAEQAVIDAENELADLASSDDESAREEAESALETAQSELETLQENDPGHWSESNGAWMIYEVFPVDTDDMCGSKPQYDSLSDAFSAELIALAREA